VPKVAVPALAGLLAGVLFLASNVAALHAPQPHGVKVAVAGAPAVALQRALGPAYTVREVASVERAVRRRDAYAGLDVPGGRVVTASAGGYSAAMTLQQALTRAAPKLGVAKPRPVDVAPLQPGDPRGQSLQMIVLGTIIGGFMMGVLTAQLALGERLEARGLSYLGFAVVFGLLVALVLDPLIGALTGHFAAVWLWAGVTALAIALGVGAFARVLGQPGIPLAMLLFLVLGNPSAGASTPDPFLPGLWRTVGPWLPPHAMASALTGSTYFEASLLQPALVLGAWIVVPAGLLIVLDRRRGSRRALAYDAAGAAADRADREAEPASATS
jgi:MFS family permease